MARRLDLLTDLHIASLRKIARWWRVEGCWKSCLLLKSRLERSRCQNLVFLDPCTWLRLIASPHCLGEQVSKEWGQQEDHLFEGRKGGRGRMTHWTMDLKMS